LDHETAAVLVTCLVVEGVGGGLNIILRNCLKLNELLMWRTFCLKLNELLMWRTFTIIPVAEHDINFRP